MDKVKSLFIFMSLGLLISLPIFAAENLDDKSLNDLTPEEMKQLEQKIAPLAEKMRADIRKKTLSQVDTQRSGLLLKADVADVEKRAQKAKGKQKAALEQQQLALQEKLKELEASNLQTQGDVALTQEEFGKKIQEEVEKIKAAREKKD